MSHSRIAIIVLSIVLAVSNALWAYAVSFPKPPEVKTEYRCSPDEHRAELNREIVHPLAAAIAASAKPGATKQTIVEAASDPSRIEHQFCIQDTDVIVHKRVGLRFDNNGKLVGASTVVCPY